MGNQMQIRTRGRELDVSIRSIRAEDVRDVRSLHARSFAELARDHHTQEQIAAHVSLVRDNSYHDELLSNNLLVVEAEGQIVGTAGWCTVADAPGTARIRKVFVAPEVAGHGLGGLLVGEAERQALKSGYRRFVVRANVNAVGFYERLGYRTIGHGRMPVAGGVELPVVFMEKG
jgi:putative acetyltransferase